MKTATHFVFVAVRAFMAAVAIVLAFGVATDVHRIANRPAQHIGPPQCEGGSSGFCFIDMPDCTEYVTYLDGDGGPDAYMTWYRQNWCTGETAAD